MDAPATPLGKSARLRHWLARHLVAIFATAVVLATVGWKNWYQPGLMTGMGNGGFYVQTLDGCFGWPRSCVDRTDQMIFNITTQNSSVSCTTQWAVTSWPSLLLDASVAALSLIVTWILFGRTQRRCQRWWQVSLSTVVGFFILAAVVCTVLKSEQLWGW